jgi:flagellar motor switch protein FliG
MEEAASKIVQTIREMETSGEILLIVEDADTDAG